MSICRNCGEYIDDGVDYCPSCGEPVDHSARSNSWYTVGADDSAESSKGGKKNQNRKKLPIWVIIGGAALITVIAAVIIIIAARPKIKTVSVSLNDFLNYDALRFHMDDENGSEDVIYNGRGYFDDSENGPLSEVFDRQELIQYLVREAGGKVSGEVMNGYTKFSESVKYETELISSDGNGRLKNGDSIVGNAVYNETLAQELHLIVSGTDFEYLIENRFQEVSMIDPLGDVDVIFSGTAPYDVQVEMTYYGDYPGIDSNVIFGDIPPEIRNGDKITLYFDGIDEDLLMREYNVALQRLTREVEVSGLDGYVMNPDELSEDILNAMKAEAQDQIISYLAKASDDWKAGEPVYEGYFLRVLNPDCSGSYVNCAQVVYSCELSSKKNEFDPVKIYFPVTFCDILDKEGVQTYDSSYGTEISGTASIAEGTYTSKGIIPISIYIEEEFANDDAYVTWCNDGIEQFMDYQFMASLQSAPETAKQALYEITRKYLTRYIEKYDDQVEFSGLEIDSAYFLNAKDQTVEPLNRNAVLIVYRAKASSTAYEISSKQVYFPVAITGIVQLSDGSLEYKTGPILHGNDTLKDSSYSVNGYTDPDKMITELISAERDDYTVEELKDISDGHKPEDFTAEGGESADGTPLAQSDFESTPYVAVGTDDAEVYTDRDGNEYEPENVIYPAAGTGIDDWADPTGANNKNEGYITFRLDGKYKRLTATIYRPECSVRNIDETKSEAEDQWSVAPTLVVTGDGKVLYEMPLVTKRSTESIELDVNVTGVKSLKIEITGVWIDSEDPGKEIYNRLPKICLGDATLY